MANAQDPHRFRVTDLGPLGSNFTEDPDGEGTFGFNNNGEVVYSMDVNGQRHAMLWLPVAGRRCLGLDNGHRMTTLHP